MDGEHTTQFTDDVLHSCTLKTYLIKQCHLNKLKKKNPEKPRNRVYELEKGKLIHLGKRSINSLLWIKFSVFRVIGSIEWG